MEKIHDDAPILWKMCDNVQKKTVCNNGYLGYCNAWIDNAIWMATCESLGSMESGGGLDFLGEEDAGDDMKVLVRLRPEQRRETNIYSNFGNQQLPFTRQMFIDFLPWDRHWTRKSRNSLLAGKEQKCQLLLQAEMLLVLCSVPRVWKDFSSGL